MSSKTHNEIPNNSVDIVQEAGETNPECVEAARKCVSAYEEEWKRLVDGGVEELRREAVGGELRTSRFRSVGWLMLLGGLGGAERWPLQVATARDHYRRLKTTLAPTPSGLAPHLDNPLSQHDQSSWHQWFCDRDLRAVIRQDVVRTFPGVDFFRDHDIQEAMVNVLFCYARDNPNMCYRQGMHEVLAPLVFVLHCDHQALLHTKERGPVSSNICEIVNPDYLEEDSYTLFRKIMNAVEAFYRISDMAPSSTGYFPPRTCQVGNIPENQVVSQLNWIKEALLGPNDPQLYQHLEKLDIPLPLFGIRWLRLMFGREFPLQDLLVLWDAIFADGPSFDLVNYIVVAMLISIRSSLLNSDYTSCLTFLMRYPGAMDISHIIEYSLHLKEPKKYKPPVSKTLHHVSASERSQPRRISGSLNANKITNMIRGAKNQKPRLPLPATPQTEKAVMDGYALDDPALMTVELRNAYAMMSLVRLKLLQYHRALQEVVPQNNIPAQEALTGIHELCSLLEPRDGVEPAYEAGEATSPAKSLSHAPSPVLEEKPPLDMTVFKRTVIPIKEPH